MDIKCVNCGEPWDIYELHEMGDWIGQSLTFDQARKRFAKLGCGAFDPGQKPCGRDRHPNSLIYAELGALLGDDVDGLAAMLDDFGL